MEELYCKVYAVKFISNTKKGYYLSIIQSDLKEKAGNKICTI